MSRQLAVVLFCWLWPVHFAHATSVTPEEQRRAREWIQSKFEGVAPSRTRGPGLYALSNWGNEPIGKNENRRHKTPLNVAGVAYKRGLFCVAPTRISVQLPGPAKTLNSVIGIDSNGSTAGGKGTVKFVVEVNDRENYRSNLMSEGKSEAIKVDLEGADRFVLCIDDLGSADWDLADWANASVTLEDGQTLWLDKLPLSTLEPVYVDGKGPPFSFVYGGRSSAKLLDEWGAKRTRQQLDAQRTRHETVYRDPASGLEVRCVGVEYHDFPTVEWTAFFRNTGSTSTPILENIRAFDTRLERSGMDEFVLHHHSGDVYSPRSYEPHSVTLAPSSETAFAPRAGRSTDPHMPYFNLALGEQGWIVVVGWPGQWSTEFNRDAATGLTIRAGQERTHLTLRPGEEIRSPLMVLQFYRGDRVRAQNIWRRWMLAHSYHRPGGELRPPQWNGNSSIWYHEMTKASEETQKMFVDRYHEESLKLDYWWMDAGWYVGAAEQGWPFTGTWEVDRSENRFPNGLRGVSDHLHSKGVKTIVWFEPERVHPRTWLAQERPEWVLGGKAGGLLNLGNPDATAWLTKHISKLLEDEHVAVYRQDFNIDPLDFWRGNDGGDRQGITENLHVQGYLAYWDGLLERNPDLHIDSCSSGGRRNDLETARRSVPYLRSDYIFRPVGQQCQIYGISSWLPFHGGPTVTEDPYVFRSNMCPAVLTCWDMRRRDLNYDLIRTLMEQWRSVAHLYLADYYPLTPHSVSADTWMAWQFHSPEKGEGMVQVFRREESAFEVARYKLRGLRADMIYDVKDFDHPEVRQLSGRELMEKGLRIEILKRPGAVVFHYEKVE